VGASIAAYFDDDAANPDERVLFVGAGNIDVGTETAERPNWTPPTGTVAVTPTVNNSAALIP
jgi:hypothetical protein